MHALDQKGSLHYEGALLNYPDYRLLLPSLPRISLAQPQRKEWFMTTTFETRPVSKGMLWTGRVISALPALLLLFAGSMKLTKSAQVIEGFSHH